MLRFVLALILAVLMHKAIHAVPTYDAMPNETDLTHLPQPGRHTVSLHIDGFDRKFIFITPAGFKPGESLPIVFFFHGAGGSAWQASRTYGWAEKAEKENFFAVFPEGMPLRPEKQGAFLLNPHIWRDDRAQLSDGLVKDVHFFEVLLNQLQAAMPIDAHRIYVTGFSNGAGMTFTLGGHFSDRIAAIAPVSSQSFAQADVLTRPLSIYYLTGTADPLIPYYGGEVTLPWGKTRTMPPVQNTIDQWVHLDGCPTQPQVVSNTDGVQILHYGPGKNNAQILFTTMEGNGHHWPGTVEPLPHFISGPTLDPFNATDRIWDFFKAHPLR